MAPGPGQLPPRHSRWMWPALGLAAIFLAVAIPMIYSGRVSGRAGSDQALFHEPTIRHFAQHWPHLCFANYLSATTPLYHVVLGAFARYVSDDSRVLRYVASIFTIGLLVTFALAVGGRARRAALGVETSGSRVGFEVFAVCLPLVASVYVLSSGVWLLPDNVGWWGVLSVLVIAGSAGWSVWRAALGGMVLALLVLTRQSHLWAAAPLWVAAWMSVGGETTGRGRGRGRAWMSAEVRERCIPAAVAVAATSPAFLIVGWFVREWGGLVVPRYQRMYSGFSPAAPAFILAILGVFSVFFAPYLWAPLTALWRRKWWVIVAAVVAGVLLAAIPETSYSVQHGRYSGLWSVVKRAPLIAGRTSVVLLVLAPVGAAALAGWLYGLPNRERWIWGVALAGFAAAQTASPELYQRYSEPMLLMLLALWSFSVRSAGAPGRLARSARIARIIGPAALAVLLGGISAWTFVKAGEIRASEQDQYVSPEELERTNVCP